MSRTIIYKVSDKILNCEFGYFALEEDAKKELELQLNRIARSSSVPCEIVNNGYLGNIIDDDDKRHPIVAIHPILLR